MTSVERQICRNRDVSHWPKWLGTETRIQGVDSSPFEYVVQYLLQPTCVLCENIFDSFQSLKVKYKLENIHGTIRQLVNLDQTPSQFDGIHDFNIVE